LASVKINILKRYRFSAKRSNRSTRSRGVRRSRAYCGHRLALGTLSERICRPARFHGQVGADRDERHQRAAWKPKGWTQPRIPALFRTEL